MEQFALDKTAEIDQVVTAQFSEAQQGSQKMQQVLEQQGRELERSIAQNQQVHLAEKIRRLEALTETQGQRIKLLEEERREAPLTATSSTSSPPGSQREALATLQAQCFSRCARVEDIISQRGEKIIQLENMLTGLQAASQRFVDAAHVDEAVQIVDKKCDWR